jgi:predicted house-cleaning NTP pyrophosphatase (Maf/HAM1 superfamily)
MEQERVEEFTLDGKTFMYIDFSNLKSNESFNEVIRVIESAIAKHPPNSVYTITNVENVRFDTESKELVAQYMENNKPYVKYGAVIGFDGIKKIFANAVFKISGRENMIFAFSKEKAVELLLQKEV